MTPAVYFWCEDCNDWHSRCKCPACGKTTEEYVLSEDPTKVESQVTDTECEWCDNKFDIEVKGRWDGN